MRNSGEGEKKAQSRGNVKLVRPSKRWLAALVVASVSVASWAALTLKRGGKFSHRINRFGTKRNGNPRGNDEEGQGSVQPGKLGRLNQTYKNPTRITPCAS